MPSLRVQTLSFNGRSIDTPNFFLYSRRLTVPNLTPDVWERLDVNAFQVPLAESLDNDNHASHFVFDGHVTLDAFIGKNYLTLLSLRDPLIPWKLIKSSDATVVIPTFQGLRHINSEAFMNFANQLKPTILLPFYDLISDTEKPNRKRTAVKRSAKFYDECLKSSTSDAILFGIVHLFSDEEGIHSAKAMMERNVSGYMLDWSNDEGIFERKELKLVREQCKRLGEDKAIMLQTIFDPTIEAGVHLFDATLPIKFAEENKALVFSFSSPQSNDIYIDLSKEKFRNQHELIFSCDSYAGKFHTRSYLFHLIDTKEMLSLVLLSEHNLFMFTLFFKEIRDALNDGTFVDKKKKFLEVYGRS